MADLDVAVIGAGVVGLAIAAEASSRWQRVAVLERHSGFGRETSSRNSEVLHSGLYYPTGSLKAELCVAGRRAIHALARNGEPPVRKVGKLIVARTADEVGSLEALLVQGRANGVEGLELIGPGAVRAIEPHVQAVAALRSPETGIVDSHRLMRAFECLARERGASIAYGAAVVGLARSARSWSIGYRDASGESTVSSRAVVNAAGLEAQHVMRLAGLDPEAMGLRRHLCKGEYFRVRGPRRAIVGRLVYPSPPADLVGLGIHTVVDLAGVLRLGPNAFYVDVVDYAVDPAHRDAFLQGARSFLPGLAAGDLTPDTAGIRPKLSGPGEAARDFYIAHEADRGARGFVNLAGIESPGLTASPAIARRVAELLMACLDA